MEAVQKQFYTRDQNHSLPLKSLLLDRPAIFSKPPDLDKGYEYGPAFKLAPDQFTKIPGKQASRRVNISHEFTTGIAGVINQFTQQQNSALEEQRTKYHKYIRRLKRELEEASGATARQTSKLDAQTNEIKELEVSKDQMTNQLQDVESKLGASEDRARRLEEKYHACKKHLNSAIQEQQDLYTRSKKQWGEVIDQVKAMEMSRNAETEMVVQKAEVIREQMVKKVRQIIAQNKNEASDLYGKIEALTYQVEEKETELNRERQSVKVLSEKLQDLQTTASGFEALAAQGKEILGKFEEQRKREEAQHKHFAEELQKRLEAITARLEALSNATSSQPETLANIQEAQEKSLRSVASKLDSLLEGRGPATKATTQLSADLNLHMDKIWQRLDDQLESLGKQLADKAEENGMILTLYKRKEAECDKHMQDFAELQETEQKQTQQIMELEGELFVLGTAQEEGEETIRRLEASGAETAQLREEVQVKAAVIVELQARLDAKERAYATELEKYSSNMLTLTQSIHEKEQSGLAAQQAAETARHKARAEMESSHAEMEKALRETEGQRDLLVGQLEILKQKVHEKEQNESRDAATIQSLQQTLLAAETKRKLVENALTQHTANRQQMENGLQSRVGDLEGELSAAKEQALEWKGASKREQAKSKGVIAAFKQWALQEGLDVCALDSLGEGNKTAAEISAELAQALDILSASQRLKWATPKLHSGATSGENSRFSTPESGQRLQNGHGTQKKSSQQTQDHVHEPQVEAAEPPQNSLESIYGGNDPLPYATSLHHLRRVVVRSPANVPTEPAAPSVDQEKARRREALQPNSQPPTTPFNPNMPRRLHRTGQPRPTPSRRPAAADDDDALIQMPPYEPPSVPMDDKTKQKLSQIYGSRETDSFRRQFEKHLTKSNAYLFESIGNINDILFARKRSLAHLAEKRRARGEEDKSEAESGLEGYVGELEVVITELTDESEEGMRFLIDCRAELEDQQALLDRVVEGLDQQQVRPEPERRERGERQRKRRVVGSGDEDGGDDREEEEDEEEEEENEEVDKSAIEQLPPLTGVKELLKAARKAKRDEYAALSANQRNHQCKHTFEKSAIMEFIRTNGGMAKCPVCSKDLRIKDLYLDEVVLRKVKRAAQARSRGVDDTSDIEPEDDGDASLVIGQSTNIKKETRPRRRMEEIDEDDD
ncbi:hypothetical protein N0V88_005239 [Collariella sp. IMI 366227]|nr:hypothetical protein N0V88_005239 [Collariella sp. IMI 366227]